MINLILYPISIVPAVLIYIWLKKKILADAEHQAVAKRSLMNGLLTILPAVLLGAVLGIIIRFVLKQNENTSISGAFFYNFFTLALGEELSKAYMMQRAVKKHNISYSWLDLIAYMVIVAIGFDLLESAVFALDTSPAQVIVRGITVPHLAYGFIMGYFAGKAIKKKNKAFYIPALLIPWVLHGTYDFCLNPNVVEASELAVYTAVALAALNIVLAVIMVIFFNKAKKNEKYTVVIHPAVSAGG